MFPENHPDICGLIFRRPATAGACGLRRQCSPGGVGLRGRGEPDYAQVWKRVAYYYGPHMLDAMISGVANPQSAGRAEDVSASLRELALNSLSRKAAWAALAVPIDSSTHLNLIQAAHQSMVAEQKSEADPKDNPILANIDAMVTYRGVSEPSRKTWPGKGR